MGADWAASRQAAQASVKKATAEYLASKAVTGVNDVVPMTDAQKDALYTAILARQPTDETLTRDPYLRRFFKVESRPAAPGFDKEDLQPVLTDEQINLYSLQRNAEAEREIAAIKVAMDAFMPAMIETVKEVVGPGPTPPPPSAR